jgi:hypothetical protein
VTSTPPPPRPPREMRLLLLTVAVSAAVLLVLSRFRFPERAGRDAAPPALPLEQLAARATYDELAAIIAQLQKRLSPVLVALPVQRETGDAAAPVTSGIIPAIRVAPDQALALLPPGARLPPLSSSDPATRPIAVDTVRGLVLAQVPAAPEAPPWGGETGDPEIGPRYVVAVEGGRAGPAFRPVFLPRADPAHDPHWGGPILALGGAVQVQPGALLFSLNGRFLGFATADHGYPAVVPATTLAAAAEQLARGMPPAAVHLGVHVQPLSGVLAKATSVPQGLLVTAVDAGGPADGRLFFGDVITAVDGERVDSEEALSSKARRGTANRPLRMDVVRNGQASSVSVVPQVGERTRAPASDAGLVLRPLPRVGSEVVRVMPGGPAARAGLRPGDVVVHVGDVAAPAPTQVARAFAAAAPAEAILFGLERGGQPLAVAVVKE